MPASNNPYLMFSVSDMRVLKREQRYNGFAKIEQVEVQHRLFENQRFSPPVSRELVKRPEAAGVLLYDSKQQLFALIEQFRIGAVDDKDSPWQLEVVAGLVDEGETPEQTVIREALEEAGTTIKNPQLIFSFYPSAGACNELFHLYAADAELSHTTQIFGVIDEAENIRVHVLKYEQLTTLLAHPQSLRNSPVIIALQWLKLQQNSSKQ
ncbi:NUDIX domain-containing protein [Alkanindiges sp. WGS2144]|uniref:NUDIX domain-containing protein n=1 Tax=Alkanindiges sp. WGS2144 TaxID=3366808 RepID=UPI003751D6E7